MMVTIHMAFQYYTRLYETDAFMTKLHLAEIQSLWFLL